MTKLFRTLGVATLVAAMTVVGLTALAYVRPAAAAQLEAASAHAGGPGRFGQAGLEAAAEALGMTVDELNTQLWAGESLADLADAAGVDLQDVQAAVTAANQAAARESVEQAVTDGTLTRDHADWLLEGLDNGYWGGGMGGPGFGPRGFHGAGRLPFNNTAPSLSTSGGNS